MTLALCFAPFFILVIGMLIGFVCVQISYARTRARQRTIPQGKWSISYRNLDYIEM